MTVLRLKGIKNLLQGHCDISFNTLIKFGNIYIGIGSLSEILIQIKVNSKKINIYDGLNFISTISIEIAGSFIAMIQLKKQNAQFKMRIGIAFMRSKIGARTIGQSAILSNFTNFVQLFENSKTGERIQTS